MKSLLEQFRTSEQRDFFSTYKRLPVLIERGEGCYLYTESGNKILDMFAGLAVNVLGYNHPGINKAIEEQIKKYIHISNFFLQDSQIKLAEKILEMTGFKKVFFSNSGTEAIEGAIKIVRKFFYGTNKKNLVSFSGSFHGRTMGALSLTARKKYRDQFAPLLPNVKQFTFNSIDELNNNVNDGTAAIFIECIQGEGGINVANQEFIDMINDLKQKYGFIVVADEIQSGVGRTGKLHSFEHFGLEADIIIIAKGIGGGLPLGAIVGNEKVAGVFAYGDHGSTFGGNPVAASCGIVIFNELEKELMNRVNEISRNLFDKLNQLQQKYRSKIKEIRGRGLMIGIEFNSGCEQTVQELISEGVLVNCTGGNVIRLLPPYIITKNEISYFAEKLDKVLMKL
ncbi:MAG: acetylornithine/succinylornithine family transaminase [Chlorobi bacterium]|nr:acetylornithine/succinylornithine family transaminase [Chlorobiota bacterium]